MIISDRRVAARAVRDYGYAPRRHRLPEVGTATASRRCAVRELSSGCCRAGCMGVITVLLIEQAIIGIQETLDSQNLTTLRWLLLLLTLLAMAATYGLQALYTVRLSFSLSDRHAAGARDSSPVPVRRRARCCQGARRLHPVGSAYPAASCSWRCLLKN